MDESFVATKTVKNLLFEGWHITTIGDMIGSMVAVFVFAVLYEAIKAYIAYHYNKPTPCTENSENEALVAPVHNVRFHLKRNIIRTVIYVFNIIYAYLLMLIAMTFNVWLFLAIVLGFGFGYFFCQPLFESEIISQRSKRPKSYGTTSPGTV